MGEGQVQRPHWASARDSPLGKRWGQKGWLPGGACWSHFQGMVPGVKSTLTRNVRHCSSVANGAIALITCCEVPISRSCARHSDGYYKWEGQSYPGWELTQLFAWCILAKNLKPVEPVLVLALPPSWLASAAVPAPLGPGGRIPGVHTQPGCQDGLVIYRSNTTFFICLFWCFGVDTEAGGSYTIQLFLTSS